MSYNLMPSKTAYIRTNDVFDEMCKGLYNNKDCTDSAVKVLFAVLNQCQIMYNQAKANGETLEKYQIIIPDNSLGDYLQELSSSKKMRPQRLLDKKIDAVFGLDKYTAIEETIQKEGEKLEHKKYHLFELSVITDQIPINVLREELPQDILKKHKLKDFRCISEYRFTTTQAGAKYLNEMFGEIDTGYSYYLVGLACTMKTDTSRRLLSFICRYMNAILDGKWNNGGNVVFKIPTVYEACGITSNHATKNKETLMKALDEVNESLLQHFSMTDKEGQPVQIKCEYLKNGEYGTVKNHTAAKETHIHFYADPILQAEKLSKPLNTIKDVLDNAQPVDMKQDKKELTNKQMYDLVEKALKGKDVKLNIPILLGWYLHRYDLQHGHEYGGSYMENLGKLTNIVYKFHYENNLVGLAHYIIHFEEEYKRLGYTESITLSTFSQTWLVDNVNAGVYAKGKEPTSYDVKNDYKHDTKSRRI